MCENNIPDFSADCDHVKIKPAASYTFDENKCFCNGNYFGTVIYRDEKIIQIEVASEE